MPSLNLRRSLPSRSILALVPVAVLAAVFALGVPGEGSGVSCESDKECPNGEACGEGVCESVEGGCGGEQDSGVGVAENQAEGALEPNFAAPGTCFGPGDGADCKKCTNKWNCDNCCAAFEANCAATNCKRFKKVSTNVESVALP